MLIFFSWRRSSKKKKKEASSSLSLLVQLYRLVSLRINQLFTSNELSIIHIFTFSRFIFILHCVHDPNLLLLLSLIYTTTHQNSQDDTRN